MTLDSLMIGSAGEEKQATWKEYQPLYDRLFNTKEGPETLLQAAQAVCTMELEELFNWVLVKLSEHIKSEGGSILLYNQEQQALELQKPTFTVPPFDGYVLSTLVDQGSEQIGASVRTFLSGEPYVCNNTAVDRYTNQRIVKMYGIRCSLTVPLKVKGECVGVIHLVNKHGGSFSEDDLRLLMMLAPQLAVVIQNAYLLRQLKERQQLLERSMTIYQDLTAAALLGGDLGTLTATLARLIGHSVVVADRFFRPLAAGIAKREWPERKSVAAIPKELLFDERFHSFLAKLAETKKPMLIPEFAWRLADKRLIIPIVTGEETLGFLSIVETDNQLQRLDMMAGQQAATVFALKMMQEKTAYETEEHIRDRFVGDLVTGEYRYEGEVLEKAAYLGYDIRQTFQVLVVQTDRSKELGSHRFGRRFLDAARAVVQQQSPRSVLGCQCDYLIILAAQEPITPLTLAHALVRCFSGLADEVPFFVGVGSVAEGLPDIKDSYEEALQAVKTLRQLGKIQLGGQVVQYKDLGAYCLLLQVRNRQELIKFVDNRLGKLLAYDQRRDGNLTETLAYFLGRNATQQIIAEELFIHLNTLKYRLQRVEEICAVDLENPEDRFNLQLAFKARDVLRAHEG